MDLGKILYHKTSAHCNKEKLNAFVNLSLVIVAESGSYQYRFHNKDLFELMKFTHPEFEYKETAEYYLISWVSAKEGKALHLRNLTDQVLDDKDWIDSNIEDIKKKLLKEIESNTKTLLDFADKGYKNVKLYLTSFTCDDIRRINNSKRSSEISHLIPDLEMILSVVEDRPVMYVKWNSTVLTDW